MPNGIDIAGFYRSDIFKISQNSSLFRAGINISNIGPRLKYDEGGQMNYIPTNLKIGSGLTLIFDSENSLAMNAEFNKLLVPSPVQFIDENNSSIIYKQPDINFLNGIIESFNDAPGGISEELKEITWAIGFEYSFQNSFLLRTGYFNENEQKGSRKFFSIGTGFYLDFAKIDISYLFSRLYFHPVSCTPVRPQELDNEGREETHPSWLKQKTVMVRFHRVAYYINIFTY